jgi:endogenous inhibitor of DNA gyrase (YacG/DUF329 family)
MRRRCAVCGNPIQQPAVGRPRRFCSHACRQLAYRRRLAPRLTRVARATAETQALLNAILGTRRR